MAISEAGAGSGVRNPERPPGWIRLLLECVMILGGIAGLADVALASLISSVFLGGAAIVVGTFEVVHAVWTRGWGGLAWQILLGLLYIALGLIIVGMAGSSVMVLTYVLMRSTGAGELLVTHGIGLLLLLSGLIRVLFWLSRRKEAGWMMLLSGAFGLLAGLVVLAEFPKTGLWVVGLLLGIDLIVHGAAWLGYGFPRKAGAAKRWGTIR